MFEGSKFRLVDGRLVAGRLRCFFCQAHRTNRWTAEHGRRNGLVVHGLWGVIELRLGKDHCFSNGYRRELPTSCHVTQCKNRRFIGLELLVNAEITTVIEFDSGVFEAQMRNIGSPSGRAQHGIEVESAI